MVIVIAPIAVVAPRAPTVRCGGSSLCEVIVVVETIVRVVGLLNAVTVMVEGLRQGLVK